MINIKTIGIIIREFKENNTDFIGTRLDVINMLEQFNVNIITIPIISNFSKIKNIISLCDGIILPGGSAFNPNDFLLVKYLYDNNIPTLGICLGMQSMVEAYNNQTEIKIKNHYSSNKYAHKVNISSDSMLYKILNKDKINVNSRHNYAIVNTNFKINALSEDNIIEGIEAPNKKFFLGVQWHPETLNDNNSYLLFKSFINAL